MQVVAIKITVLVELEDGEPLDNAFEEAKQQAENGVMEAAMVVTSQTWGILLNKARALYKHVTSQTDFDEWMIPYIIVATGLFQPKDPVPDKVTISRLSSKLWFHCEGEEEL